MNKIDWFDLREGWSKVPNPLGDEWKSLDDALEASGYDVFVQYLENKPSETSITVYQHADPANDAFMVSLDTFGTWRLMMAADLPSLIDLHRQLAPMLQLSLASGIFEMIHELHDLLTQYRTGPLQNVLQARERRRQYYEDMLKGKAAG